MNTHGHGAVPADELWRWHPVHLGTLEQALLCGHQPVKQHRSWWLFVTCSSCDAVSHSVPGLGTCSGVAIWADGAGHFETEAWRSLYVRVINGLISFLSSLRFNECTHYSHEPRGCAARLIKPILQKSMRDEQTGVRYQKGWTQLIIFTSSQQHWFVKYRPVSAGCCLLNFKKQQKTNLCLDSAAAKQKLFSSVIDLKVRELN